MRRAEEKPGRTESFDLSGHGFVVVWDFMGQELGLKNADLVVYARIFGFENSGKPFFESKNGTAKFFGLSERAVFDAVKRLKARGLIEETGPCPEAKRIGSKCYKVAAEPLVEAGIVRLHHEEASYEERSPHEDAAEPGDPCHEAAALLGSVSHEGSSPVPMQEVQPIPKQENKHFRKI